jgi:hypothetical protein
MTGPRRGSGPPGEHGSRDARGGASGASRSGRSAGSDRKGAGRGGRATGGAGRGGGRGGSAGGARGQNPSRDGRSAGNDRAPWQARRDGEGRPRHASGGTGHDRRRDDERSPWQERRPARPRATGDDRNGNDQAWRERRPGGDRGERSGGPRGDWRERRPQDRGSRSAPGADRRERRPQDERSQRPGEGRGDWRERRPQRDRSQGPDDRRGRRPEHARAERPAPLPAGPEIPDWADPRDLDPPVRAALRGLDPRNAQRVAGHLIAAGTLVDEDPETALAHARAARDRASRIAVVREAVGVAAYHAGDYAEAARELRAYRRMSGDPGYRAVLADCERALGRPEVALRLVGEALGETTDPDEVAELRLVESGVRRDLGEIAAARLVLEAALGGRPTPDTLTADDPPRLRLAAAYADLLEANGDIEQAERWRAVVDEVDPVRDADAVEFFETEEHAEVEQTPRAAAEAAGDEPAGEEAPAPDGDEPEVEGQADEAGRSVETSADEAGAGRRSFDEEVEAEVAELLGETGPAEPEGPSTQH